MADDIIASMELKGGEEAAAETGDALDALLKAATGQDATDDTANTDDNVPADVRKADDDAKAKVKAEEDAARADADAAEKAKTDAAAAEKAKADEAAKPKDDAAAKDDKKDEFDNIELPPHVKPKTVESFALLKQQARTRVTELTGSITKLEEDLKAANEALKLTKEGGLTPEDKKELEELRNFRRGIDVESDPEFAKFDEQVKSNDEAIYARLEKAGFNKASIDKIKSLGGPSQVDWDKVSKEIPSDVRRFLDVKLVENESLADQKVKKIAEAKKNSEEFLKTRRQETEKGKTERVDRTSKYFEGLKKQIPWLAPKETPKDAKAADKVLIEAHNKKVAQISKDLQEVLNDDSPETHALLVVGYGKLQATESALASEKAERKTEVDALKKTIAEKEEFIKSIQKSSTGRIGGGKGSSAPADGKGLKTTPETNIEEDSGAALDRLRAQVEATHD